MAASNVLSPLAERFDLIRAGPGGISGPQVRAILEDHLGDLWIGTNGDGLNRLDRKTGRVTVYRHDPGDPTSIGSDVVRALLEDRRGDALGRRLVRGALLLRQGQRAIRHLSSRPASGSARRSGRRLRHRRDAER